MGSALMGWLPDQSARDSHKYYTLAGKQLAERQKLDEEALSHGKDVRLDFFHYLFRTKDPETGRGLSNQQLQADAGLLIAAGSDGVAVTVSAAVFYLLRDPATLEKLIKELRSSFSGLDEVRTPKLNQLPYLAAVIDEALRLAPSVPSAFPRQVLRGGLVVDGQRVPEGMTVSVATYPLHHNEAFFPDSFAFRPERWMSSESEKNREAVALARSAMFTFGAGPYNCVGLKVAILASKLVLAKMLYKYDIRAVDGVVTGGGSREFGRGRQREGEYQLYDHLVSYRSGPVVQLKEARNDDS
jgi:cytochrome P450